jgi:hypothetical protein
MPKHPRSPAGEEPETTAVKGPKTTAAGVLRRIEGDEDLQKYQVTGWVERLRSIPDLDQCGETLVIAAATSGHPNWLAALGLAGCDLPTEFEDEDGSNLIVLVRENFPRNIQVMRLALRCFPAESVKAVANQQSSEGQTPLAWAIDQDDLGFAKLLLAVGAECGELVDLLHECDDPFEDDLPPFAAARNSQAENGPAIAKAIKSCLLERSGEIAEYFTAVEKSSKSLEEKQEALEAIVAEFARFKRTLAKIAAEAGDSENDE